MPRPKKLTPANFQAVLSALAVSDTASVAGRLGLTARQLHKIIHSEGLSIRQLRRAAAPAPVLQGVVVRRSAGGPAAAFGADALAELPDRACRWPIGDPAEPGFRFCGAPKVAGRSYCQHHLGIAYPPRSRASDAVAGSRAGETFRGYDGAVLGVRAATACTVQRRG
jgi:hypothetical protein